MSLSRKHRVKDAALVVPYALLTFVSGAATGAFGLTTVALGITAFMPPLVQDIAVIPVGLVTAVSTAGLASLSVFAAAKTKHKFEHAMGHEHNDHSTKYVKKMFSW